MTHEQAVFAGKTAVVTGASDGIGFEIAKALADFGCRVLLPVRNREKGQRALARIGEEVDRAELELFDLDLSSLRSVDALVRTLLVLDEPIDFLMINAGIVQLAQRTPIITEDGHEVAFQTNFLGHFGLVIGLLPLLRRSQTRIVLQCSIAARGATGFWESLLGQHKFCSFDAYRSSKTALGLFGYELDRRNRAEEWGLSIGFCHPGIAPGSAIAPEVRALIPQKLLQWLVEHLGNSPHDAARTAIAALGSVGQSPSSMFVPDGMFQLMGQPREAVPFREFNRPGDARMLWRLSEQWSGQYASSVALLESGGPADRGAHEPAP